ncbi:MAG: nucleotidyltransferase family protein [Clostridiales bacterium]
MNDFTSNIINSDASCLDALRMLDMEKSNQTLFVLNTNGQLIGTVTDGDIRRGLIKGFSLDSAIVSFCNSKFSYINGNIDVEVIRKLKKEGIKVLPKLTGDGKIEKIFNLSRLNSILPVHAVIMAGGRGERLRPLTDNLPKPMLPLGGKPIMEHNIDRLISYGIQNITISVGYLSDIIIRYFGDGSSKGVNITYVNEEHPLGTIGSLSQIPDISSDTVLVMNSDLFTNIDFESFYLDFLTAEALMAVASIPYTVEIPYAIMDLKENEIISFTEKPKKTYFANAGIYLLNKTAINFIPQNQFYNATDLMDLINKSGGKLIHSPISGYWIDIGKRDDYNKAIEIIKHTKVI